LNRDWGLKVGKRGLGTLISSLFFLFLGWTKKYTQEKKKKKKDRDYLAGGIRKFFECIHLETQEYDEEPQHCR